ncbi:MAG: GntR family transcriptional regulator [Deltaproteobacteria bacterium HGW-Deltaproteobacteria-22]|jgi:DNA-binding transcriptional regulator YhcF (GntR family)|nr:MAG: GntR family transcriptional regulator [Deltaproteobacteria bacterium HGW-Deltaproteobacteria-22]
MQFSDPRSIYLQLADAICDLILRGTYASAEKIPSVRELAGEAGVNPNTILRTVSHLTDQGILYNQRGVGTFVSENARETIMQQRKKTFLDEELTSFFKKIELLGIDFTDLAPLWSQWKAVRQEVRHENQ